LVKTPFKKDMSKIGKQPIKIPSDVKIDFTNGKIIVEGPKGKLERNIPSEVLVNKKENEIVLAYKGPKEKKALWGTWRAHIFNLIEGAKNGFEKNLKIEGVGWRASIEGEDLSLKVGFSHPVKVSPPEGINFVMEKDIIKIVGINKELVGNVAAKIRAIRPPEPYKGKGIRYVDEVVKRKAGKKAVTALK
jgi:large subunit ribosomal protein L6